MTIAPSLGIGVFVAVNGAESPRLPDLVSRAIIEEFAGVPDLYPSRWTVTANDEMKEAARAVAGVYAGARRVETRFEKIASVGSEIRIAALDDGSLAVTAGETTRRYYPLTENIWTDRSRDRLFAYRGKDGSVQRISLSLGTDTAEPVSFLHSSDGLYAGLGIVGAFAALAMIAAWRRQGRDVPTTAPGRWLALGHVATALLWIVFIGIIGWASIGLSAKELPELQQAGWPPASLLATQIAAHMAVLAAILVAAGVFPVLTRSGWSLWRKGHYIIFAAAGLFAAYQLWNWRLILAPMSG